jgi:hypothetical protein
MVSEFDKLRDDAVQQGEHAAEQKLGMGGNQQGQDQGQGNQGGYAQGQGGQGGCDQGGQDQGQGGDQYRGDQQSGY